ncbi:MAG: carbon storage regulator [Planctomycetota bacterium]|jgi:carbon storage regulator
MLVLSRKPGERILVGNDVVITIVRIGPNTVRLGIDAPGHMNIVREELCEPGTVEALTGQSGQSGTTERRVIPR